MNTSLPADTSNDTLHYALYNFSPVCEITVEPLKLVGVKYRLKSECTDATLNLSASSWERLYFGGS